MSAVLKQTEIEAQAAVVKATKTISVFSIAVGISVFVHAVILTMHFEPELKKLANKLPSLNVVLVNAKTKTAPDKAELLAQANLDRGGNTDANRQMKSMLPAPKQKTTEVKLKPSAEASSAAKAAKLQAQEVREQKHVDALEKHSQANALRFTNSPSFEGFYTTTTRRTPFKARSSVDNSDVKSVVRQGGRRHTQVKPEPV